MKNTEQKAIAVAVRDIHKEFVLPQHKHNSVKQAFVNVVRRNGKVIQKVLDGVSFEVYKGDFFGIVGRNGGGKSTLLKILAGVYTPTSGEVVLHGGLTPYIELGVGFNPELSGRDNVFLNGALLGFSRKEMEAMYDEIVDFAELSAFMDQKLKNYSSGMQVRLAFSIAIKAHSDILIFDEVLAVGDEAFQRKCLDVFERYKAEGQTVILVTHHMETVKQFCNRALLISDSKVMEIGDPHVVASRYSELNLASSETEAARNNEKAKGTFHVEIGDAAGKPRLSFAAGEQMRLTVNWNEVPSMAHLVVNLYKLSGEHITGFRYTLEGADDREVTIDMKPNVAKGKYRVVLQALRQDGMSLMNEQHSPEFIVSGEYVSDIPEWSGLVYVDHKWVKKG